MCVIKNQECEPSISHGTSDSLILYPDCCKILEHFSHGTFLPYIFVVHK